MILARQVTIVVLIIQVAQATLAVAVIVIPVVVHQAVVIKEKSKNGTFIKR